MANISEQSIAVYPRFFQIIRTVGIFLIENSHQNIREIHRFLGRTLSMKNRLFNNLLNPDSLYRIPLIKLRHLSGEIFFQVETDLFGIRPAVAYNFLNIFKKKSRVENMFRSQVFTVTVLCFEIRCVQYTLHIL